MQPTKCAYRDDGGSSACADHSTLVSERFQLHERSCGVGSSITRGGSRVCASRGRWSSDSRAGASVDRCPPVLHGQIARCACPTTTSWTSHTVRGCSNGSQSRGIESTLQAIRPCVQQCMAIACASAGILPRTAGTGRPLARRTSSWQYAVRRAGQGRSETIARHRDRASKRSDLCRCVAHAGAGEARARRHGPYPLRVRRAELRRPREGVPCAVDSRRLRPCQLQRQDVATKSSCQASCPGRPAA